MLGLFLLLAIASLGLTACTDRQADQSVGRHDVSDNGGFESAILCDDEMSNRSGDCDRSKDNWTDEERRKAEPMPLPKSEAPPPELAGAGSGASEPPSVLDDNAPVEVTPPVESSICDDDTLDARAREACAEQAENYWTDERRRKAKPLNPTVPAPDNLTKKAPIPPTNEGSSGGAAEAPSVFIPKPEDQN